MNKIEAIKQIQKMILKYRRKFPVKWCREQNDTLITQDLAKFKELVKMIQENNFKKAYETVYWMDTAPRDWIPSDVYDYIHKRGTKEEKK